jgi:pimeloyl-[acyl-carrier protein] methyl ester esterase
VALYTQTVGAGPDLMLVHGWGLHAGIWKPLLPLLEAHFRVTCVDLPGHGRSDWQGEETLDAMAGALLAVAPAGAAWLGWSLGGLVAARAALLAPARVNALIEIASSPCFVCRPGWQSAMLPVLLDTFAAELAEDYARTLNRFLALQVRGSEDSTAALKMLRALMLLQGEPNAEALRAGLELLRTTDMRDRLAEIKCPVLLLAGERDTLVPLSAMRAARELFRNAQLQVVDGAGHAPFIAQPERVARLIAGFLCEDIAQGG